MEPSRPEARPKRPSRFLCKSELINSARVADGGELIVRTDRAYVHDDRYRARVNSRRNQTLRTPVDRRPNTGQASHGRSDTEAATQPQVDPSRKAEPGVHL
jgi:hypothetical protein